jgi:hypothetical protein
MIFAQHHHNHTISFSSHIVCVSVISATDQLAPRYTMHCYLLSTGNVMPVTIMARGSIIVSSITLQLHRPF